MPAEKDLGTIIQYQRPLDSAVIGVNPNKEQGDRARVLEGPQKPPVIHKSAHPVPLYALLSPECNRAQASVNMERV